MTLTTISNELSSANYEKHQSLVAELNRSELTWARWFSRAARRRSPNAPQLADKFNLSDNFIAYITSRRMPFDVSAAGPRTYIRIYF